MSNTYIPWLFALTAFIISALTNRFLLQYLRRRNVLDIPNERSSHKIPTPRGGGIGILAGVVLAGLSYCGYAADYDLAIILALSLVIGAMGWVDDVKKGLSTGLRFLIQLACAAVVIYRFGPVEVLPLPAPANINLGYFSYVVTVMWLVGITNIFNFLDGIDGYAGTQGVVAGGSLSFLGILLLSGTAAPAGFAIGLIVALACLAFLMFNWHPAKIFMGDVGSSFLGFLLAALPFLPQYTDAGLRETAFFAMALFLWFFLLDGTFTMLRRLLKGEKIWQAHRSHLYQRLVISGLSHSQVVLFILVLHLILLFVAYLHRVVFMNWYTLASGFVLFFVLVGYTTWRERRAAQVNN